MYVVFLLTFQSSQKVSEKLIHDLVEHMFSATKQTGNLRPAPKLIVYQGHEQPWKGSFKINQSPWH